ncbi:MAG: hypothetical protein U0996_04490 [Planctomycetaceae bacterium]
MKSILLPVFALSACLLFSGAFTGNDPTPEELIRKTLHDQEVAWNKGDIPGFMKGYVRDESLRFSSGGNTERGWDSALKRYMTTYSTPEKMGKLKLSDFEILVLSDTYAEVFGKFYLTRDKSVGDASGLYTLLMKKQGNEWLVWHDHSSSADE